MFSAGAGVGISDGLSPIAIKTGSRGSGAAVRIRVAEDEIEY